MKERRLAALQPTEDPYSGLTRVHAAPAYDLIVSLRALYNPRIYKHTRAWAAAAREQLDARLYELGRFYFQGADTALAYGSLRLAPELPAMAEPEALIRAVRLADARALALRMLDTGETPLEALDILRRSLAGEDLASHVDTVLRDFAADWARRCRRLLADPEGIKAELVDFLEQYHAKVFRLEVPQLVEVLNRARTTADDLLAVLPTVDAIDRLTGGYTLGDDLALRRITLAPSVFIYPFMSARVDETSGEALIVYGVRSSAFLKYEQVPLDPSLVSALKALADPGRLKVIRLVGQRPMFGPELVKALDLTQQTVHHHLAQLRAAGLVRQERTRGGMRYTIRSETAGTTLEALQRLFTGAT